METLFRDGWVVLARTVTSWGVEWAIVYDTAHKVIRHGRVEDRLDHNWQKSWEPKDFLHKAGDFAGWFKPCALEAWVKYQELATANKWPPPPSPPWHKMTGARDAEYECAE